MRSSFERKCGCKAQKKKNLSATRLAKLMEKKKKKVNK